jgi:uncharacterized membrane protein
MRPPVPTDDERERLIAAARRVRWWPGAVALVALGVIYALLPDSLRIGPAWAVLAIAVVALGASYVQHRRGSMLLRRRILVVGLAIIVLAESASAFFLIGALLDRRTEAGPLLLDGALVWVANILVFALLYWETDGGGPAHRHAAQRASTDFAFPQRSLGEAESGWMPEFLDYVFLAFNTSTAFSPTDTAVLGRHAKVLTMWQSLVSLITAGILIARAVNTI